MSNRRHPQPNLPDRSARSREQMVQWEGPVPPPQAIEAYERLVPGSAELLWRNFDEQSKHRRDLEKVVVSGSETRASRGQFIAAALIVIAMAFGLAVALFVSATAGSIVIVGSIASGAAIYIAGGRQSGTSERGIEAEDDRP